MRTLSRLRSVVNRPQTGPISASLREAEEPRRKSDQRPSVPSLSKSMLPTMPAGRAHRMVDRHDAVTSAVERWCSGFATDIVRRRPTIELGCGAQPKTCCTWNALSLDICACAPKMEEFVRPHSRFDDSRRLEIGFPALDPKLAGARSREGGCPACGGGTLTEPPAATSLDSARTNALVKHESLGPLRVPLHPLPFVSACVHNVYL